MSYTPGPLPEPQKQVYCSHPDNIGNTWTTWRPAAADYFTAEQLSAHTAAEVARAVAAERERWIALCKDFAADTNPPRKDYEDTYQDGWIDACNEVMWSGENPSRDADPQRLQGKVESA